MLCSALACAGTPVFHSTAESATRFTCHPAWYANLGHSTASQPNARSFRHQEWPIHCLRPVKSVPNPCQACARLSATSCRRCYPSWPTHTFPDCTMNTTTAETIPYAGLMISFGMSENTAAAIWILAVVLLTVCTIATGCTAAGCCMWYHAEWVRDIACLPAWCVRFCPEKRARGSKRPVQPAKALGVTSHTKEHAS